MSYSSFPCSVRRCVFKLIKINKGVCVCQNAVTLNCRFASGLPFQPCKVKLVPSNNTRPNVSIDNILKRFPIEIRLIKCQRMCGLNFCLRVPFVSGCKEKQTGNHKFWGSPILTHHPGGSVFLWGYRFQRKTHFGGPNSNKKRHAHIGKPHVAHQQAALEFA